MTEIEIDQDWWKIWKNRRYILCVMLSLGILSMYGTRINLSVAIVAMTTLKDENGKLEFDWTPQMKGYLLSAFFYSYAFMQTPAGIIVKHIPPHTLYGLAVFISAILTMLTPLVANYFYILLIFRIIMGFFQAAAVPTIIHFMTNWAPPLERSRMQALCISGAFIGTVMTLPLSGIVGAAFGWQWIFYVFAIISFVWCFVWVLFFKSSPFNDKFMSAKELEYICKSIGESTDEKKLPIPWNSIATSVPVISLALTNFTWGWGFQTMLAQLPPFLKDVAGFELAKNGMLSSVPYITMAVMSWTAGYVADLLLCKGISVTRVRKIFINSALTIQSGFIIIAAFTYTPWITILCISMSVGFGAFTYAAIGVNPMDLAPPFSPILAGFSNTFGTSTGMISPIIVGYVVTADKSDVDTLRAQWQLIFFICAGIYLTGSAIFFFGGNGNIQPWAKTNEQKPKSKGIGLENLGFQKY